MGRVTSSLLTRLRRHAGVPILLAVVWLPSPLGLCGGDPGGPGCASTGERARCASCPMTEAPRHAGNRGCTCCKLSGTVPGEPTWTTAPPATAPLASSRSLPLADAVPAHAAREHRRAAIGTDGAPPRYLRFGVLLI